MTDHPFDGAQGKNCPKCGCVMLDHDGARRCSECFYSPLDDERVGQIASLREQIEEAQKETRTQKDLRVKYQGLIYDTCNELDAIFGRHVTAGQGHLVTDVPLTVRRLDLLLTEANARIAELEAELQGRGEREEVRTDMRGQSNAQIVGETLALLANDYSGEEHQALFLQVTALLRELERNR